jgi:hypothetical protein
MGSTRDANRIQTAMHESGHAVIAVHLGGHILVAEFPDPERHDYGHVETSELDNDGKGVICAGGAIAESRFNNEPIDIAAHEPCEWAELLAYAKATNRDPQEFVLEATDIIDTQWSTVLYFGQTLAERDSIPGEEATRLIRNHLAQPNPR